MSHHEEAAPAPRTRKKNPLVEFEKAKAFADRARKAAARAVDLAEKARDAVEKSTALAALRAEAEKVEQEALTALQNHLAGLKGADTSADEGDGE